MGEKKKVLNVLQWILVGIVELCYLCYFLMLLITNSFLSAAIMAVLMVLIFPPVFKKIPPFRRRMLVAVLANIVLVFVATYNINVGSYDSTESSDVVEEAAEPEEKIKPAEEKVIEQVEETPKVEEQELEEKAAEETEKSSAEDDWYKEYREWMDSLSLQDWITENIEAGRQGSEYDWEGIEKRKAELTEKKFYKEWCSSVKGSLEYAYSGSLKEFNSNGSTYELEEYCKFLESAVLFFDAVYPDNDLVDPEIKPLFEEAISSANDVINCANTVSTYPSETFYVSNKYAEKGSITMWVAYGTYYDSTFETQMTDADSGPKAILRTSISHPFPASNKYVIEYQDSGETKEVESESGFSSVIPIYDIVSINGEGKENYNDHVLFDTKQKYGEKWAAVYNYFN